MEHDNVSGSSDERLIPPENTSSQNPAPSNGFYGTVSSRHGAVSSSDEETPSFSPRDPYKRPAKRTSGVTFHETPKTPGEFTGEHWLRSRRTVPKKGWRRNLYRATFGMVNMGPSEAELKEREVVKRVRAPLKGTRRIAVISRKGGVGKTTSTVMLGHIFAAWRGDRVVALDGNPDAGSLAYRVRRETKKTLSDLLTNKDRIVRYSDMRAYTSQAPTRLEILASDDDPRISTALGEEEYHQAIDMLERHYNMILLDTGTGILDSATRGILDMCDQVVVVTAPSIDSARATSLTLDWLDQHGYGHLVKTAVACINGVREGSLVELKRLESHFDNRVRSVVRIPFDPHLEAGAETAIDELRPGTRSAYLQLAAAVADSFSEPPPAQGRFEFAPADKAEIGSEIVETTADIIDLREEGEDVEPEPESTEEAML